MYKIKRNRAKCLKCNQIIESKYRHDFVTCKCGNLSVDGGKDYLKKSVGDVGKYEDMSEWVIDEDVS
jgi:Zn finger protein HypA/HybF involved in hydrogenase expression